MEFDTKTILIIGLIVFGIYWLSQNQPEIYNTGVDTIKNLLSKLWDAINGLINKDKTQDTSTTEGVVEGDIINYGKPLMPFECTSDVQCQVSYPDVEQIKCNLETGECYKEAV